MTIKNPYYSTNRLSRRKFLTSSAVGGSFLLTAGTLRPAGAKQDVINKSTPNDPLTESLSRYGSELGNIRQTD